MSPGLLTRAFCVLVRLPSINATHPPPYFDILGRFDKLLYVGPLSEDDRRLFITQSITQSIKDYEYILNPEVVRLTEGFTGADMALLIRKLLLRMYNNSKKEQPLEVNEALTRILTEGGVQKSVSNNELIMYNRWQSSACMF